MEPFSATLVALSQAWAPYAWLLRSVLMGILLLRILLAGLRSRYPVLVSYLALSILRSALLASVPYRTTLYGVLYVTSEPLLWLAYAAVCWEIYGLVFEKYSGLSILSRRTLIVVLGISFTISLFAASRHMSHSWDVFPLIRQAGLSSRTVLGTFLLFLLALLAFMSWFRMVVNRNITIYVVSFSLLFVGVGMGGYLSASAGPEGTDVANFLMIILINTVLCAWMLAFRRTGEETASRLGPTPGPIQERELLASLENLNRLAAAATKRI